MENSSTGAPRHTQVDRPEPVPLGDGDVQLTTTESQPRNCRLPSGPCIGRLRHTPGWRRLEVHQQIQVGVGKLVEFVRRSDDRIPWISRTPLGVATLNRLLQPPPAQWTRRSWWRRTRWAACTLWPSWSRRNSSVDVEIDRVGDPCGRTLIAIGTTQVGAWTDTVAHCWPYPDRAPQRSSGRGWRPSSPSSPRARCT